MKLREIHQIELTSRCNLTCAYCVHKTMLRRRMDMTLTTFEHALLWVKHFVAAGTQGELNLAGIGESTLHLELPALVARARQVLGPDRRIIFATNGVGVTEELVKALMPSNPRIWVSLHRPERAAGTVGLLRQYGLLDGISTDPATNPSNWAGQIDWPSPPVHCVPCPWLGLGWGFVAADGSILTCCIDGSGESAVGNVIHAPAALDPQPWRCCDACYQTPRSA
jgi:hypothetical protein